MFSLFVIANAVVTQNTNYYSLVILILFTEQLSELVLFLFQANLFWGLWLQEAQWAQWLFRCPRCILGKRFVPLPTDLSFQIEGKKILFIILDEYENLSGFSFIYSISRNANWESKDLKFQILHVGSGGCSTYSRFPVLGLECNELNAVKARKRQDFNLKAYFKAETPRKLYDLFLWSNIREFIASQV